MGPYILGKALLYIIGYMLKEIVQKICNRRPLVGAVGAYKRGDARRKDSDLCFARSLVLRIFTCAYCFAHLLVLHTFTCAYLHIHYYCSSIICVMVVRCTVLCTRTTIFLCKDLKLKYYSAFAWWFWSVGYPKLIKSLVAARAPRACKR